MGCKSRVSVSVALDGPSVLAGREEMFKVLVCGDRNWTDSELIRTRLAKLVQSAEVGTQALLLIHGAARGADSIAGTIARAWAETMPINISEFPANWGLYGRAAGPIRNREMLQMRPDLVLAFHDDIESSRGTKNMVAIARKTGVPVEVIKHEH